MKNISRNLCISSHPLAGLIVFQLHFAQIRDVQLLLLYILVLLVFCPLNVSLQGHRMRNVQLLLDLN